LRTLARLPAKGGPPGELVEVGLNLAERDTLLSSDPFRRDLPPAEANRPIWPWLVLVASCLFFADVFVRRVQIQFQWLWTLLGRARALVLRQEAPVKVPETMKRLRSRKQQISQQLDRGRRGTRFEPSDAVADSPASATPASPTPIQEPEPATEPSSEEKPSEESYTERLLKAKRQVWDDRKKSGSDH